MPPSCAFARCELALPTLLTHPLESLAPLEHQHPRHVQGGSTALKQQSSRASPISARKSAPAPTAEQLRQWDGIPLPKPLELAALVTDSDDQSSSSADSSAADMYNGSRFLPVVRASSPLLARADRNDDEDGDDDQDDMSLVAADDDDEDEYEDSRKKKKEVRRSNLQCWLAP